MMPNFEYTHSAEKARDTTLNDEKYSSQRNGVVITLNRGRHLPANNRNVDAYIEMQRLTSIVPYRIHKIQMYARGLENVL